MYYVDCEIPHIQKHAYSTYIYLQTLCTRAYPRQHMYSIPHTVDKHNLRLPNKEVRMRMTELVHDMLHGGGNLLWISVASIHILQFKDIHSQTQPSVKLKQWHLAIVLSYSVLKQYMCNLYHSLSNCLQCWWLGVQKGMSSGKKITHSTHTILKTISGYIWVSRLPSWFWISKCTLGWTIPTHLF